MSFRIQFTVTDEEFKQLKSQADNEGFPTPAEMCKMRALGKNSYADLYKLLVKKIEQLEVDVEFYLRDLIPVPPALLGRWLFDAVADGKIPNVVHLGNDGTNPEKYRKI